jgi:hypothetical protein
MGKQAVFYAKPSVVDTVNEFCRIHDWHFVEREWNNGQSTLHKFEEVPIGEVMSKGKFRLFLMLPKQYQLPTDQENIHRFISDKSLHVEFILFMKHGTGYDSRMWFQTPNHSLDKDANALLRKTRKAIKDSQSVLAG